MTNDKKTPRYAVSWWLWNGNTFERYDLEVEAVNIPKCSKYRFFLLENPVKNWKPGRTWIIAEGGTGYVLAYGSDAQAVLKVARGRFQFEKEGIREADVTCYIQGHLNSLQRHVGHLLDFQLPAPHKNIIPVLQPGEMLHTQFI